jgi:pimeloyl-ACP methyl ester carboxylesterase
VSLRCNRVPTARQTAAVEIMVKNRRLQPAINGCNKNCQEVGWLEQMARLFFNKEELSQHRRWIFAAWIGLIVLFVASAGTFIGSLVAGLNTPGVHYINTNPLTVSWIAVASTILSMLHLIWISLFFDALTQVGLALWIFVGMVTAAVGFINTIAFAVLPNDAGAAAVSFLLWTIPGCLIAFLSFQIRADKQTKKTHCCSLTALRQPSTFCVGFMAMIVLFVFAFILATCVQATSSAADYNTFKPLGTIYTIRSKEGIYLQLHMACMGPTAASMTWIFEHGGGSNSASLKYIADRIADRGYRSCVYDRLGYGWTPSYVTTLDATKFSSSAEILTMLLDKAGEKGPYVCVGHSAGAEKCLRFAAYNSQVKAIGFLDGYPDIIRAGSLRPGRYAPNNALLSVLKLTAVLLGPTGITRGLVGKADPGYVPKSLASANTACYAQSRFWFSQYWDVQGDIGSGDAGYAFLSLQGSQDSRGLVRYNASLQVKVGIYPAESTVTPLNCDAKPNDFCCTSGKGSNDCNAVASDNSMYLQQAELYANTVGTTPGVMLVAPPGSDHGFPYTNTYADWLVNALIANLTVS